MDICRKYEYIFVRRKDRSHQRFVLVRGYQLLLGLPSCGSRPNPHLICGYSRTVEVNFVEATVPAESYRFCGRSAQIHGLNGRSVSGVGRQGLARTIQGGERAKGLVFMYCVSGMQ